MMKVKTYLGISNTPGAGVGLFAGEVIPTGTVVWEFDPSFDRAYAPSTVNGLSSLDKDFIAKYAFVYKDEYILCVDNARFFNHSETPNCYSDNSNGSGCTRSNRDIQNDEELTDDYGKFGLTDEDNEQNHVSGCASFLRNK